MEDIWRDVANRVKDVGSRPEKFLEPNESLFDTTKILAKVLYDSAKLFEDGRYENRTLPELIIENFDEEQVWAGVELQNSACEQDFQDRLDNLSKISAAQPNAFNLFRGNFVASLKSDQEESPSEEDEGDFEDDEEIFDQDDQMDLENEEDELSGLEENNDQEEGSEAGIDDDMKEILKDPDFQHMSDSEGDDLPLFGEKDSSDSEDENDLDEEEERQRVKQEEREKKEAELTAKADDYLKSAMKNMKTKMSTNSERSKVEDRFFSLDDMEKFLEAEEARDRRTRQEEKKRSDSEDEDNDLDLFEGDFDGEKKEANAKYSDYFNDDTDDNEEVAFKNENEFENSVEPQRGLKRLLDDESSDEETNKDLGEPKSSFELRNAKLKKEIQRLEDEAIREKPWQMVGEVTAQTRPENSLLQEHLDYDNVAKQAPVITEEVSRRLEDVIVQRIKDRAWDDVQRKIKTVENPYEYKKRLILDQEKSKLSLAEVYEQEYLKQKGVAEEANKVPGLLEPDDDGPPPEVDSIKRSMNKLFAKLDTLTHFHYTPKPATADVKIIHNAPTISMEEVAPVAMSDANLLAPQEIVDKKRSEDVGKSERTSTDKKRERRKKKLGQKLKAKEKDKREKLVDKLNPGLGNKHSKKKVLKEIEKAEKEGKIVTIKSKSKAVKSSTAFFNQLQDETVTALREKTGQIQKKKKSQKTLSGARLKL